RKPKRRIKDIMSRHIPMVKYPGDPAVAAFLRKLDRRQHVARYAADALDDGEFVSAVEIEEHFGHDIALDLGRYANHYTPDGVPLIEVFRLRDYLVALRQRSR